MNRQALLVRLRALSMRQRVLVTSLLAVIIFLAVALVTREGDSRDAGEADSAAAHDDHDDDKEAVAKRVKLSAAGFQTAQIQTEAVQIGTPALASPGLEVPGQVDFDPRRIAVVSPRTDGRIERLTVVEGDLVGGGQAVALLNSKEFLTAQSDLQHAARRAGLLAGGPDAQGARALAQAARRRLALLGVSQGQIARVERGAEPSLYLPLVAPFGGSIMKTHVLAGQAVHAGDPVFTIADLRAVDVVADIPEQSISMVRVGQAATVTLAAFPTLPFVGTVERLRQELNPETRTVRAVIHVTNSNGQLRPGMFASVRLAVPSTAYPELNVAGDSTRTELLLTIPESAVVTDGDRRYVFVLVEPMTFERREVQITPLAPPGSSVVNAAHVLVRGGLKAGELVVTRGAFTLKSELAKAGLGEHAH